MPTFPNTATGDKLRQEDHILRLQCLAAAHDEASDGTGLTIIIERAQTIYYFVTDTKPEDPS